jgi:antitoxin VapB
LLLPLQEDHAALHIEDSETDRFARELAAVTGESTTAATRQAIKDRLARVRARAVIEPRTGTLRALIARGRARPMLDQRDGDTILGYADHRFPA